MAIVIASILQAAASLVLAGLTWHYVKLTRQLSEAAQKQTNVAVEQLRMAREALEARVHAEERNRVRRYEDRRDLLQRIQNMLADIGGREFWGVRARTEPVWEDQELEQILALSADRPALERADVGRLNTHLRWLKGEVMKLRAKPEGAGHDPGSAWSNHADTALRLMDSIRMAPL